MALYIPHSIFHLARLLYVRPETFGPYHVCSVSMEHENVTLQQVFRSTEEQGRIAYTIPRQYVPCRQEHTFTTRQAVFSFAKEM